MLDNIPFIICVAAIIYFLISQSKGQKKRGKISGDFKSCQQLNSKTEQIFKHTLKKNLPNKWELHCKVRLADLCKPKDPKNFTSLNKVTSKHVDYVVVEAYSSNILFAIELDDSSHNTKKAKAQDKEKDYALDSAGIELYRVKPGDNYHDAVEKIIAKHS
ncbi:DUF2726 domain-containing protein [Vibrio sp. 10N.239.312.D08]|uniref:DUF2726 domain-containing protein n=1 Tax=Vibrio sp. 10N.239.312.D08 TaxID=3229978 RepID=UPI003552AFB5